MTVSKDSRNDCVITLATIVSLTVIALFDIYIDGYIGILVSVLLLRTGILAAKETLSTFMGRPVDKATADNIKQIVLSHEGVFAIHDLVVHNYGPERNVATVHAEMPMDMRVDDAHKIIDAAEKAVWDKLGISLSIHMDPVDAENRRLTRLKDTIRGYLAQNCPSANAHEFYLTGDDLAFELEVPHSMDKAAQDALRENISQIIRAADPTCCARIDIEFGFVAEE